jgi:hypothetical protein
MHPKLLRTCAYAFASIRQQNFGLALCRAAETRGGGGVYGRAGQPKLVVWWCGGCGVKGQAGRPKGAGRGEGPFPFCRPRGDQMGHVLAPQACARGGGGLMGSSKGGCQSGSRRLGTRLGTAGGGQKRLADQATGFAACGIGHAHASELNHPEQEPWTVGADGGAGT